jgi:hypothetical protein
MHAIGFLEGVTLLEFEAGNQEVQPQEDQGEGEQNLEALHECPDNQPFALVKGEPRSILSLLCFMKYQIE